MIQGRGIYYIMNASAPVRIGLIPEQNPTVPGTTLVRWEPVDKDDHMWLIEPVDGQADTYTIRNVLTGAYMDLNAGTPAEAVISTSAWTAGDDQKWIITQCGEFYKIKNKASNYFADLRNGGRANGTPIVGVVDGPSSHQLWNFRILSCTSSQVRDALTQSPYITTEFKEFNADTLYLILPRDKLSAVWRGTSLCFTKWRKEIFDCDDFATVFKAEMYGENESSRHAYNWTLDLNDRSTVIFFEPQNGRFSNDIGYNAYFGLF
ncbi:hypothetical protein AX16_007176 [Volvariella volvacea WC 439]|nr:hypothetical protein AX16_007176 [Volvariella volvacea WC 439]